MIHVRTISLRLLQIGFGFAVRAAVDSVLSVGKPEFMDDFLLGCGDAAGILAAENIDQCCRQVEFFLFDDSAVLDYNHSRLGIDKSDQIQVDVIFLVNLDDILAAQLV